MTAQAGFCLNRIPRQNVIPNVYHGGYRMTLSSKLLQHLLTQIPRHGQLTKQGAPKKKRVNHLNTLVYSFSW